MIKLYGLLGNNGSGKSTLLKFLAERPCRLPGVPEGLDMLLVEQETTASEVSVVEQVLAADTMRTALLAEERILWSAVGGGGDTKGEGDGEGEGNAAASKDWTELEWASFPLDVCSGCEVQFS